MYLFRGRVKTTYTPNWKGIEDVEDFTEGLGNLVDVVNTSLEELLARLGISEGDYEEETIDFDIADIVVNENGETVIIGTNGEERNIGTANNTVVTDGNGDKIAVNKDGETGAVRTNEESTARDLMSISKDYRMVYLVKKIFTGMMKLMKVISTMTIFL